MKIKRKDILCLVGAILMFGIGAVIAGSEEPDANPHLRPNMQQVPRDEAVRITDDWTASEIEASPTRSESSPKESFHTPNDSRNAEGEEHSSR